MEIRPGQFVRVVGSEEGIGKCVRVTNGFVEVEWFFSVVDRRKVTFPASGVEPSLPDRQTRCYWFNPDTDCWETGRLLAVRSGIAYVAFPEEDQRTLPEAEVFVRSHCGRAEPLELMRDRFFETPYFHYERAPLVEAITRQRAATHGLSGLLSSRIHLFDHQIDVVRRVLEDPVQRYLLADEVGLGKTIEAGVILRQLFLDSAAANALVVTPETLAAQWRNELAVKHGLTPQSCSLALITHDALATLGHTSYDIVVIDEAHHVAKMAYDPLSRDGWERCRRVCHASPRLLLLSATPALHHEADFLAMLHLLEPQTYSLEDLEGFRTRIGNREGVATALDVLQEGMRRAREIREAVEALREHLADDDWVQEQADQLQDTAKAEPERIDEIVRAIRMHICETHRVHRRMLRSSRRRIPEGLLPQRATGPLTTEWVGDVRAEATQYALDSWREAAVIAGADDTRYLAVFRAWLSLSTTWAPLLRDAIACRLAAARGDEGSARRLGGVLSAVLMGAPLFPGERELLERWHRDLLDDPGATDQIDDLLDVLQHHRRGRRVVFTAYTAVAQEIVRRLQEVMHPRFLYPHLATDPPEERYALLERFAAEDDSAVLVCDHTGEEGLNLQFADRLFHFDLPWEPNRLEQRIGRLDRIGRRSRGAAMHVFLPEEPEESFTDAFLAVLREGIDIFAESAADLQFFVDRECQELVRLALHEGAAAVRERAPAIREAIQDERRLLRQQAALDELDAYETDEVAFAATLREEDADARLLQSGLSRWMCRALHFDQRRDGAGFVHTEFTLLPRDRWLPISQALPAGKRMTFVRDYALSHPDTELMRLGHPFVDRVVSYMEWEDRGKAFALWRRLRDEISERDRAFFRFDVIVEPDPGPLESATSDWDGLRRQPLLRQAAGWLPPRYVTLFLEADSAERIVDPGLLEALSWPYERAPEGRASDTNLGRASRRPVIGDVLPEYERRLDRCHERAVEILRADPDHRQEWERGARRAQKTLEMRLNQIRRGLVYRGQEGDVATERCLYEALIQGILEPRFVLDAVGLIVLSNRNPFEVQLDGGDE